jgi:hypothetical protein
MPGAGKMSWKIAFVLSAPALFAGASAILAGGCNNDACDLADQQLQACLTTETVTTPSTALDCTIKRQCQASCIQGNTCQTINAAYCIGQTVCPPEASPAVVTFRQCMTSCEGM